MSHDQPPPGPYGQPHQPPQPVQSGQLGPYSAPPPPPPSGPNPYAQGGGGVPGQPGYGQPQGMPGTLMPPPPSRAGGKGKVIGIVTTALVVVAAGVGGAFYLMNGDELAPYKVVPPRSLLDGDYLRTATPNEEEELANDPEASKLGVDDGKGSRAAYTSEEKDRLELVGVYGEISDPKAAADAMFERLHKNQADGQSRSSNNTVKTTQGPKEYSPSGFDGTVLKCETRRQTGEVGTKRVELTFATCVWADEYAVGVVSQTGAAPNLDGSGTYGAAMEQDALADATVKIRKKSMEKIEEK